MGGKMRIKERQSQIKYGGVWKEECPKFEQKQAKKIR